MNLEYMRDCCCMLSTKVGTRLIAKNGQLSFTITEVVTTMCHKTFYYVGGRYYSYEQLRERYYIIQE